MENAKVCGIGLPFRIRAESISHFPISIFADIGICRYFWVQNIGDIDIDILYCGAVWPHSHSKMLEKVVGLQCNMSTWNLPGVILWRGTAPNVPENLHRETLVFSRGDHVECHHYMQIQYGPIHSPDTRPGLLPQDGLCLCHLNLYFSCRREPQRTGMWIRIFSVRTFFLLQHNSRLLSWRR